MLVSFVFQKEEEFGERLRVARQEQMGPLSAASMEMGSYLRGYECILRCVHKGLYPVVCNVSMGDSGLVQEVYLLP